MGVILLFSKQGYFLPPPFWARFTFFQARLLPPAPILATQIIFFVIFLFRGPFRPKKLLFKPKCKHFVSKFSFFGPQVAAQGPFRAPTGPLGPLEMGLTAHTQGPKGLGMDLRPTNTFRCCWRASPSTNPFRGWFSRPGGLRPPGRIFILRKPP